MSEGARPGPWLRAGAMVGGLLALAAVGLAADRRPAGAATAAGRASVVSAAPSASSAAASSAAASAVASAAASAPVASAASGGAAGAAGAAAGGGTLPDGRVVLNLAGEEDLRRLPGIGPSRAQAILALRQRQGGRFRAVADLLRVKGLGRKTLARLAPRLVLDAPPA